MSMSALVLMLWVAAAPSVSTEGLLAFFDAGDKASVLLDGDRVVSWSGQSCTATASGEQRPSYVVHPEGTVRPCLRFDGTDDVLRVADFNRRADTWSLIVVAAPNTPAANGALCSAVPREGNDFDPGFTVDLFQSTQSFNQISIEGAGRVGGQIDQMKSSFGSAGLHIVTVVRDADEVTLYVDGSLEGTRPVTPAQTIMDELRIGSRYYDKKEQGYFRGDIAQVLLYSRTLDDEERAAIEESLKVSEAERAEGEQSVVREQERRRRERMMPPKVVESWPNVDAYRAANPGAADPASLPIRTDVREAIVLSVNHLNSLYNADKDNEPFFYINREADGTGKTHHSVNIGIPHVVGRCLVGCEMAERGAGVPFPPEGLAILERYLKSSYDNPDHLNSYYDPARGGARFIEFHNMREGLYGLWALIAGRQSDWAKETAHEMLVTLDRITDADGAWSQELAKQAGMLERCEGLAIPNATRLVDPLLAYYDCTKDPLAMKLAGLYARKGLKTMFLDDGTFAPMERSSGHVHSITSSLSGITDYAVRTGDKDMLAACRRIVAAGVPGYFSSWGWGDEVFPEHPADVVGRGEINQTGDVARVGLILGEAGLPEYYDLAERYLRSMLLPTQHREKELRKILRDKPDPKDDSERDTVRRSIGGYAMQLPNDRMRAGDWPISTLDITSGAVHAMSECYRLRTTCRDGAYRMNLLFDFEDEALAIDSELPVTGRIAFRAKKDIGGVEVRVPEWVDARTGTVTLAGQEIHPKLERGYAQIGALKAGQEGVVTFDVPCKIEKETVDGTVYTTTWIGNQIVDIKPRGTESPIPF